MTKTRLFPQARRGASEVVGALTLTFIVLIFMSLIAVHFAQSSRSELGGYVAAIRQEKAQLLESLVLIDSRLTNDRAVLWLLNNGKVDVEIVEVDVEGCRLHLNPPILIRTGQVGSIEVELNSTSNQRHVFLIHTLNGGIFRFEVTP